MKLTIAFITSIFLFINSCGSQKGILDFSPVTHNVVSTGQYAPILKKSVLVERDGTQNKALLDAQFLSDNGLNSIDFDKHMLLEVFIGEKSTAGYSISIDAVQENAEEIHFYYTVLSPDGMAAAVMTQPYLIVSIAKTDKRVLFFENGKLIHTNKN